MLLLYCVASVQHLLSRYSMQKFFNHCRLLFPLWCGREKKSEHNVKQCNLTVSMQQHYGQEHEMLKHVLRTQHVLFTGTHMGIFTAVVTHHSANVCLNPNQKCQLQ